MIKKLLFVSALIITSLSLYLFIKEDTIQHDIKEVRTIGSNITNTLIPSILSHNFDRTGIFIYNSDYSYRYFLYSQHVVVNSAVPKWPTKGDTVFEEALEYHKANLCYIKRSTDLPSDSLMYSVITEWQDIEISPNVFYISCPLFIENTLIGYIGSVLQKETFGIVSEKQQLLFLKYKIEAELTPFF